MQAQSIKFGLRAGANINDFSLSKSIIKADNLVGFQVGPVVEIGVIGLSAEAGLLYNMKGAKLKAEIPGIGVPIIEETVRNSYLDIPINLKYNFGLLGIGAYAAAGPYFSYALDGKNFNETIGALSSATDGDISDFDIGLNFGLGVKVSKIGVGVQYGLGLSEVYTIPKDAVLEQFGVKTGKVKNRNISLLLTYYF